MWEDIYDVGVILGVGSYALYMSGYKTYKTYKTYGFDDIDNYKTITYINSNGITKTIIVNDMSPCATIMDSIDIIGENLFWPITVPFALIYALYSYVGSRNKQKPN